METVGRRGTDRRGGDHTHAVCPQWQPLLRTGGRVSARVRAALGTAIGRRLPARPQTLADVIALGLPAYQSAHAAVLDLVYAGYQLARYTDAVKAIAARISSSMPCRSGPLT